MILNPNCSEVIAKLPVSNMNEAKRLLKSIGLKIIRYDPYVSLYENGRFEYSKKYTMIIDPENPNSPDFEHTAKLSVGRGSYEDDGGIWMEGHQHSQHQLYPTIKRIIEGIPDVEFSGYDGGGSFNELYDKWVEEGAKTIPDYQHEIRDEIKSLLKDKDVKNAIKSFYAVDLAVKKRYAEQDKYKVLREAVKKSVDRRKKQIIKNRKILLIKRHNKWEKELNEEHPDRKSEPFKMPSDEEVFTEFKRTYDFHILGAFYTVISNKQIAEVFLQKDQKTLQVLGKMVNK